MSWFESRKALKDADLVALVPGGAASTGGRCDMSWFESRRALEDADPFAEPWVEVKQGRRVVIETGDLIQVNVPYERYQHPDWFDGDVFQLDSAGLYRYRPVEDERRWPALRDGFTAYERVQ